jgi:DNA-binding GntR family transcriptional regulator
MEAVVRKPLEKRPLYREQIRHAINKAIISGELKPGDRIVETKWARELGVSQSPVREAIRELEMIGLVENVPYQGCFVRKITRKELLDSYKVRMCLELLGIQEAAEGINDKHIEELQNILKEMEQAAAEQNFMLYIKKDVSFHKKILEISENELLVRTWEQCNFTHSTYIGTMISQKTLEQLSVRHEELFNALSSRDLNRAKEAVCRHFEELMEDHRFENDPSDV